MKIRKWCVAVTFLFAAITAFAQNDVNIGGTSAYLVMTRGASWGAKGYGGIENNYIFSPPTPDSTVCVAIRNNNPTNLHAVSITLQQALDPSVLAYTGNSQSWVSVPWTGSTFPVNISARTTASFFFRSSSAARLALSISGTTVQGGSPDTADVTVVQPSNSSYCGSAVNGGGIQTVQGQYGNGGAVPVANMFPVVIAGSAISGGVVQNSVLVPRVDLTTGGLYVGGQTTIGDGTNAVTQMALNSNNSNQSTILSVLNYADYGDTACGICVTQLKNSRRYGMVTSSAWAYRATLLGANGPKSSFWLQNDSVNPAAAQLLVGVVMGGSAPSITPNRAIVSCSAACDVTINKISNAGTTCGTPTAFRAMDNASGNAPQATVIRGTCAANPTVLAVMHHIWIAAGTTQTVDLAGYWQSAATSGFDVANGTALTGTASVTLEYSEAIN